MNLERCGEDLSAALHKPGEPFPEGSLLAGVAGEFLRMGRAYLDDGWEFFRGGDPVNALASFAYAFGWVDCGSWIGLIAPRQQKMMWGLEPGIPSRYNDRLQEKTTRYARLLSRAILVVTPAAETGTLPSLGGNSAVRASQVSAWSGDSLAGLGYSEEALFCYSYGHAWLDAAIRAGLLRVGDDRELFTL